MTACRAQTDASYADAGLTFFPSQDENGVMCPRGVWPDCVDEDGQLHDSPEDCSGGLRECGVLFMPAGAENAQAIYEWGTNRCVGTVLADESAFQRTQSDYETACEQTIRSSCEVACSGDDEEAWGAIWRAENECLQACGDHCDATCALNTERQCRFPIQDREHAKKRWQEVVCPIELHERFRGPTGKPAYASPRSLGHNMTRIYGKDGKLYLENKFGQDIESPHADRVVIQSYGSTITRHSYEVLERPAPIAWTAKLEEYPELKSKFGPRAKRLEEGLKSAGAPQLEPTNRSLSVRRKSATMRAHRRPAKNTKPPKSTCPKLNLSMLGPR